jgi:superoxide dismutase, Fe-Mn family
MHTLPELPYRLDALEPHISRETLDYHYGKHHRAYVQPWNSVGFSRIHATNEE